VLCAREEKLTERKEWTRELQLGAEVVSGIAMEKLMGVADM
jgi:hypothetical protein